MARLKASLIIGLIFAAWMVCAPLARAAEPALRWTNLSSSVPTTTLDQTASYPLLSFASSRGTEWLAGSPNQLFQVTSKGKIFDLTPDLKKFGFQKIRQVASDGQSWLVIGDSSPWFSQPDLAFRYDGIYWKNVSPVMASLPPQEWVGQIVGKRGFWIIPTSRSLIVWQSSLKTIANIPLPPEIVQNQYQEMIFYPLRIGWLMDVKTSAGRCFYVFDGQNFKRADRSLGAINQTTTLASNGAAILSLTALSPTISPLSKGEGGGGKPTIVATYFDGQSSRRLDQHFISFVDNKRKEILFFPEAGMVWDGKSWLLKDYRKHLMLFNGRAPVSRLPDTRDTFIDSAYGASGLALHVGYNKNSQGDLVPRLVMTQE
ncbi:MAG: hypothetical protein PHC53_01620 [Patescibacteria group bacterium]|nr:hypothetical protein [Patescibacteria group bacterium]